MFLVFKPIFLLLFYIEMDFTRLRTKHEDRGGDEDGVGGGDMIYDILYYTNISIL